MYCVKALWYYFLLVSCSQFGKLAEGDRLKPIQQSQHYDISKEVFVNKYPSPYDSWRKKPRDWLSILHLLARRIFHADDFIPGHHLPEGEPRLQEFTRTGAKAKTIWLGHSTVLLNIKGKNILFDPVFSQYASPIKFFIKRFQPPAISLEALPHIDFIVISHDHYDHLDKDTVSFFADRQTQFLVPLGVAEHLVYWGIDPDRIQALDWWEEYWQDGLRFIAAPARHFSGRTPWHRNKTLWASWVITSASERIYFSGDSGYSEHFKVIGDKFGPFTLAYLESGQYNDKWADKHLLPRDFVQAYQDLRAERYFPIHWAMFCLSVHPWEEPAEKLQQEADTGHINLITPKLGEMITIGTGYKSQAWWR